MIYRTVAHPREIASGTAAPSPPRTSPGGDDLKDLPPLKHRRAACRFLGEGDRVSGGGVSLEQLCRHSNSKPQMSEEILFAGAEKESNVIVAGNLRKPFHRDAPRTGVRSTAVPLP